MRLDGAQSAEAIRDAFEAEFGEPLSQDDLGEFLEMVGEQGLIESAGGSAVSSAPETDGFDDEEEEDTPTPRVPSGRRPFRRIPAQAAAPELAFLAQEPLRPRSAVRLARAEADVPLDARFPDRFGRVHPGRLRWCGLVTGSWCRGSPVC